MNNNNLKTYLIIANVVICAMSVPLLSSIGVQPGSLVFTLYWLCVVCLMIIFLVVPYFKEQRKKDDS